MIHVQIASELTADGVRGVRWVLLEAAEPLPEADAAAAPIFDTPVTAFNAPATAPTRGAPAASAPAPVIDPLPAAAAGDSVVDSLRLRALKALVVALGLGAALWTAAVQIGPPGRPLPTTPALTPRSPPAAAPAAASPAKPAVNPPAPAATPHAMPTLPRPRLLPSPLTEEAPAASAPLPSTPASSTAPQSATDTPAAPASASLPRLTASL